MYRASGQRRNTLTTSLEVGVGGSGGRGQPLYSRSHCRLAKLRGLKHGGNYNGVISLKEPIAWKFILGTYKITRFSTNHSAVFPLIHQTTEFAKRQYERQWLTLPSERVYSLGPELQGLIIGI